MITSRPGLFGTITLRDVISGERQLLISDQVQGGAYLDPPASIVDPEARQGPGPISSSVYTLGWFLAGAQHPTGSGLMVGLGSGAGAIDLIYNFPGIDLTIIEIDPAVVDLAQRGFPLLELYQDTGNLSIIEADATEYLTNSKDRWDFALVDGYTGGQSVVTSYLPALCQRSDDIYVNCIDTLGGESMLEVTKLLLDEGHEVQDVLRALPLHLLEDYPFPSKANWIITTVDPNSFSVENFLPYPDLDHPKAALRRLTWDAFLESSARQYAASA